MGVRGFILLLVVVLDVSMYVPAAATEAEGGEERVSEIDPTNPVFLNFREEFYNLKDDGWRNAFILRTDIIRLGGLRNFILRFDLPFVSFDPGQGGDAHHGLGDLYGQALLVPYATSRFFLSVGSGLTLPTASQDSLGAGKWQVSPLIIPGWRFQDPRGLFFVKIQDFVSVAGKSDRADIHYMTIMPLLAVKVGAGWWAGADTEAKIDWERGERKSYKSGVLLLRMWTRNFGTWVKPELPWGPHREGDWNLKASFFWNY
jgi:hypothetical protein